MLTGRSPGVIVQQPQVATWEALMPDRNRSWSAPSPRGTALALSLVGAIVAFPATAATAVVGEGPVAEAAAADPITVEWRLLRELDYTTGHVPDALKAVDGKLVRVPGYMVPLEDFAERSVEFLLVPYFGACIHTPPPPPNQLVYVVMGGNRLVDIDLYDPIWIEGTLHIEQLESIYGSVGYQISGVRISPYRP